MAVNSVTAHSLTTDKSVPKIETLKPFCLLFFALAFERIFIKTQSIESRWFIVPENIHLQTRPCVIQPENVHAGAVKGLGSDDVIATCMG